MSAQPVDYWGIREAIRAAIRAHPELGTMPVHLERTSIPSLDELPCVLVFLTNRETIPERQRIGAGRSVNHRLTFSVWVIAASLEGQTAAARLRDEKMALVEVALLADRSLGGAVSGTELSGGEVQWSDDPKLASFSTAIETLVICDVEARI